MAHRILENVRVIDLTWWQQASAGYILGDLGAEVIKIEDSVHGDPQRWTNRYMGVPITLPNGSNANFEAANRNKKSVKLNLRHPKGRELLNELAVRSDVFVNNFRPSVRAAIGIDYTSLEKINPRIIYATSSGYGEIGPDANLRAFDTFGQARSGLMHGNEGPDHEPRMQVVGVADQMTATSLAYGIIAALYARERYGIGQHVQVSLLGTMIHAQNMAISTALLTGRDVPAPERCQQYNPLVGWYKASDGKWLALAHNQPQEIWGRFCASLGLTEIESDPRFATTKARGENYRELIAILDQTFSQRRRDEWLDILRRHDLNATPVQRIADLAEDPQVIENKYIVEGEHPTLGRTKWVGFPVHFSRTPPEIRGFSPEFGQDTETVLSEVLGRSWNEIEQLHDLGVI